MSEQVAHAPRLATFATLRHSWRQLLWKALVLLVTLPTYCMPSRSCVTRCMWFVPDVCIFFSRVVLWSVYAAFLVSMTRQVGGYLWNSVFG